MLGFNRMLMVPDRKYHDKKGKKETEFLTAETRFRLPNKYRLIKNLAYSFFCLGNKNQGGCNYNYTHPDYIRTR